MSNENDEAVRLDCLYFADATEAQQQFSPPMVSAISTHMLAWHICTVYAFVESVGSVCSGSQRLQCSISNSSRAAFAEHKQTFKNTDGLSVAGMTLHLISDSVAQIRQGIVDCEDIIHEEYADAVAPFLSRLSLLARS